MTQARQALGLLCAFGFVYLVLVLPAMARQDPSHSPSKDVPPKGAGASIPALPGEPVPDDQNVPPPAGPPDPYGASIKDASTGLPLWGTSSTPLRWGSFSISSLDFIGVHDDLDLTGSSNTLSSDLFYFRVGLMFDHYLLGDKSRVVLQYIPQMAIANGQIHANAALNNDISLGTKFELTPRLSLSVGNLFVQTQSNPLLPLNYLAASPQGGTAVQNNFLETNGSFIADTASAVFEYGISPRTNLTFSPVYRYSRATNSLPSAEANGQTYSGIFSLGHALSPHRTIGIVDSFQYASASTTGSTQNTTYNTIGGFYSQQLARTVWVSGNAGAVIQSSSNLSNAGGWGFNGGFSLVDNLTARLGLTLAYTRGLNFNNYVTLRRSDRVDAATGLKLTSRISWNNSFGYYRELGGIAPTGAKYAESDLSYRIRGSFNFFTTFAYTFQNASTAQLLSGGRRTLAYGLRWAPPSVASR